MSGFYKRDKHDKVWWYRDTEHVGKHLISFDKRKIYNLYADYPHNLTKEQKELFDKENPYWAELLKSRCENG